jgi:hypothetical protein
MDDRWLSVDEIAVYLGVSKDILYLGNISGYAWAHDRTVLEMQKGGCGRMGAYRRCRRVL